jgi:hypothetical protein
MSEARSHNAVLQTHWQYYCGLGCNNPVTAIAYRENLLRRMSQIASAKRAKVKANARNLEFLQS